MSVPQTTGKPTGTRGHCSLLTFPHPHLKTRVTTRQAQAHVSGCTAPVGTHPGMPIIAMCGKHWQVTMVTHGAS